jgi:hypothetical protein
MLRLLILSICLLTGCGVALESRQAWLKNLSTEDLCDQSIADKNSAPGALEEIDREIVSRSTTCQIVFKSMSDDRLCRSHTVALGIAPNERLVPLDREVQSRGVYCHDLSWQSSYNQRAYKRRQQELQDRFRRQNDAAAGMALQGAIGSLFQSTAQNAESLIIVGGAMSAASTPRAVGRLPNDDIPLSAGFTCPLRSSAASGMYRNCSYDCAGGIVVQSVSASTFCPTSIRR